VQEAVKPPLRHQFVSCIYVLCVVNSANIKTPIRVLTLQSFLFYVQSYVVTRKRTGNRRLLWYHVCMLDFSFGVRLLCVRTRQLVKTVRNTLRYVVITQYPFNSH